uniref:Uncharacterized protein n=1 Tax=Anguilla anguilla TaxID=7936 RepID=A0A0E9VQH0_ANGAN
MQGHSETKWLHAAQLTLCKCLDVGLVKFIFVYAATKTQMHSKSRKKKGVGLNDTSAQGQPTSV